MGGPYIACRARPPLCDTIFFYLCRHIIHFAYACLTTAILPSYAVDFTAASCVWEPCNLPAKMDVQEQNDSAHNRKISKRERFITDRLIGAQAARADGLDGRPTCRSRLRQPRYSMVYDSSPRLLTLILVNRHMLASTAIATTIPIIFFFFFFKINTPFLVVFRLIRLYSNLAFLCRVLRRFKKI